jgi:hypothetical protein
MAQIKERRTLRPALDAHSCSRRIVQKDIQTYLCSIVCFEVDISVTLAAEELEGH